MAGLGGDMAESGEPRRAGIAQAVGLMVTLQIPIVPIMALVPNLPLLLRHFAATPNRDFLVPLIITVPSLAIVLLGPVAGALADKWGRRRLLLWALGLFAVAGVLPIVLDDLRAILATQALVGVADAVIMTNANTLFGDYFPAEQRNRWLGVQSIIGPFFAALVTVGAGFLGTLSWHGPFAVDAVAGLMLLWLLPVTWEPRRNQPGAAPTAGAPAREGFPWSLMIPIFAITFLTAMIFYAPTIYFGVMYDALGARSPALIAVLTTAATLGSVFTGNYFRTQKHGPALHLALIYGFFGAGLLGCAHSSNYWIGLAFGVVVNCGIGLTIPSLVALALGKLPAAFRGRGMGLWMSSWFCAQILCPPVFAVLMRGVGGIRPAFTLAGGFCLVLAAISIVNARRAPALPAALPGG